MVGCLRRNLYPFVRQFEPYPLYLRKACWLHLYLPVALRFAAFVVENRQAGRYKLLSKTLLAVLHQRSSKLWFRQVPRPILTNARQQTAKQFNSFSKSGNYKCFYCLHFMLVYICYCSACSVVSFLVLGE
jgi:hypothetical protein